MRRARGVAAILIGVSTIAFALGAWHLWIPMQLMKLAQTYDPENRGYGDVPAWRVDPASGEQARTVVHHDLVARYQVTHWRDMSGVVSPVASTARVRASFWVTTGLGLLASLALAYADRRTRRAGPAGFGQHAA
jgi:hypothetical protein